MNPSVSLLEAIWITVNVVAIIVVLTNLAAARADRRAYEDLGSQKRSAREVAADGNVRREWLRLIKQVLLLIVVFPSLLSNIDIPLYFDLTSEAGILLTLRSIAILCLIAVPFVMLYGSITDARDRRKLASFTLDELMTERENEAMRVGRALADLGRRADHNDKHQTIQDDRLDEQERRFGKEIERTDNHQGEQDGRLNEQGDLIARLQPDENTP